jgi:hypothetical protein
MKIKLAEIANDLEQRRIEILKNNAQGAKQQVKDAQARMKMKKGSRGIAEIARGCIFKSFVDRLVLRKLTARNRSFAKWRSRHIPVIHFYRNGRS